MIFTRQWKLRSSISPFNLAASARALWVVGIFLTKLKSIGLLYGMSWTRNTRQLVSDILSDQFMSARYWWLTLRVASLTWEMRVKNRLILTKLFVKWRRESRHYPHQIRKKWAYNEPNMYIKNVIFNAQIPLLKAYIFLIFRPPSTKLGLAELGVENFHAVVAHVAWKIYHTK